MLAKITSGTLVGLSAQPIDVEVDVSSRGLPSFTIAGLPDKAVSEAKERVRSALLNFGASLPARRITVNLAPADLPKQDSAYDVPIALGLLLASGEIEADIAKAVFFGELSLDGNVRATNGTLPLTLMAKEQGYSQVFVPANNAKEAAIVSGVDVFAVESISQLVAHITKAVKLIPTTVVEVQSLLSIDKPEIDMADIHGQETAKRAMEIAAAGGHNVFLKGVPGAGKSMLSRAFAGILPQLTEHEALEVTKIYSISGQLPARKALITMRPFRSPHHTTSLVGLIGGGSIPKPGEISLAHRGVLFMDEIPEFPRSLLEALRQPLEDGEVHIARAQGTTQYPSRFILVAVANPCPCGNRGSNSKPCTCSSGQVSRYQKKISGPIMNRIDMHVFVSAVDVQTLVQKQVKVESSDTIQKRVQQARDRQKERFEGTILQCNAEMSTKQVKHYCKLSDDCLQFLSKMTRKLDLSARSYFKVIRVARTIADLAGEEKISVAYLAEAAYFRPKQNEWEM